MSTSTESCYRSLDSQRVVYEEHKKKSAVLRNQSTPISPKVRMRKAIEIDYRVDQASKGVFEAIGDFFASIPNGDSLAGKIGRALLFGAVVGIAAGFLFSNPIGWIVFGAATATYLIGQMIIPTIADAREHNVGFGQMFAFKFSAWQREMGFRGDNYNHVYTAPNGAKIFLGALPNKNSHDLTTLVGKEEIGAVISINEPWERKNIGVSNPYTRENYEDVDIHYHEHDVHDHSLLPQNELLAIALEIADEIRQGRNVYVHCRAGVGRSAMGVAAYLIAVEDMSADAAAKQIKDGGNGAQGRKQSTIMKKLENKSPSELGLRAFADAQGKFLNQS